GCWGGEGDGGGGGGMCALGGLLPGDREGPEPDEGDRLAPLERGANGPQHGFERAVGRGLGPPAGGRHRSDEIGSGQGRRLLHTGGNRVRMLAEIAGKGQAATRRVLS